MTIPNRASDAGPLQPDCPSCDATPRKWSILGLCVRGHRVVCDCCVMVGNAGLLCPECLVEMAAEGLRTEQRVHDDVETGVAL